MLYTKPGLAMCTLAHAKPGTTLGITHTLFRSVWDDAVQTTGITSNVA